MVFDWKEFFALAQYLQTCTGSGFSKEAALRTAVGRVYFTAYALARDFAIMRHGFTPSKSADDHGRLIQLLKGRRAAGLGNDLEDLRGKRNSCDYESEIEDLQDMFDDALAVFQMFERKLK